MNQPRNAGWVAALPDFSRPAVSQRVRIGGRDFQVQLTSVQHDPPGEPGTDLVQCWVLYRRRPLAAADLGITGPFCSNLWSYLTSRVTEVAVDFYAPQPLSGESNPRLGCWGYRPDLALRGEDSDCNLAVIIGVSVATAGSRPIGDDQTYLRRLRDAVVESLTYWVLEGVHLQGAG